MSLNDQTFDVSSFGKFSSEFEISGWVRYKLSVNIGSN